MSHFDPVPLLITQTWQVAALAIGVWFTVRIFAKNRPHLAHALWALVLIKCLTPPLWSSPTSPFSWVTADQGAIRSTVVETPGNPVVANVAPEVIERATSDIVVHVHPEEEVAESASLFTNPFPKSKTPIEESAAETPAFNGARVVGMIWTIGVLVGLTLSLLRYGLFAIRLRRNARSDCTEVNEYTDQLRRQLKIRSRVRVMTLDLSIGPAVIGLFRPTILIPNSLVEGKPVKELRPLLAHELVHVRRGDLWWAFIQTLAKNLLWFHPLVWWAARMVTRESERSCDEETIASLGCRPATYARCLLEVLEQKHRLRSAPALPGVRPIDITSARLERVMRLGQGSHRRTPFWVWMVMFSSATLVLPGASLVGAQQQAEKPPTYQGKVEATPQTYAQPLPQAQDGQPLATRKAPSWTARRIQVAELLDVMREEEFGNVEAMLLGMLGCRTPSEDGTTTPNGMQAQIATEHGIVTLGNEEPTMKIVEGILFALGEREELDRVEKTVKRMQEYGFKQIVVETKFITTTPDQLREMGVEWSVATSAGGQGVAAPQMVHEGQLAQYTDDALANSFERKVQALTYVEQNRPVLFSVLDQPNRSEILDALRQNERTNVLSAPKITMFNGQAASIVDGTQRPFVVGLDRARDEQGNLTDTLQPVIRVIKEGTTVNLTAISDDSGVINLDCEFSIAEIRGVETQEVPIGKPDSQPSIQIPEVATTRIQSSLDVPEGKTLILGSVLERAEGKKEAFLVLVTCHVIDEDFLLEQEQRLAVVRDEPAKVQPIAQATEPQATEVPAQLVGQPQDLAQAEEALYQSASQPEEELDLVIKSSTRADDRTNNRPLIGALKELGFNTAIEGKVDYQINNDGIVIEGQGISVLSGEKGADFRLTGDEIKLEIKDEDDFKMSAKGAVNLWMSGTEVTADAISYGVRGMLFEGKVSVMSEEMEISAERVEFDYMGSSTVTIEGAAKLYYKPEDQAPTRVTAERIRWNPETNEIEATSLDSEKDILR